MPRESLVVDTSKPIGEQESLRQFTAVEEAARTAEEARDDISDDRDSQAVSALREMVAELSPAVQQKVLDILGEPKPQRRGPP